jgi:acyl carrier protein
MRIIFIFAWLRINGKGVRSVYSEEELIARVSTIVRRELCLTDANFSMEHRLEDLPMDSLEYVSIIQTLRNEIGEIDEEDARDALTIGDLVRALRGRAVA